VPVLDHLQRGLEFDFAVAGQSSLERGMVLFAADDARTHRPESRDVEGTANDADWTRVVIDQGVAATTVRSIRQHAPVLSMPPVHSRYAAIDSIIVRENLEGLYSGVGARRRF
jgi:isocitrate dehydrogenase (NAD+)